ncbi:uncharacterized protein VTP21DRAFT_8090 [Calcarisporiella thermophila]|uniref:uncharacterized protein n=1 Tax=Calcarisporiella thermophila TaxID=911321 RepID=UPI0037446250
MHIWERIKTQVESQLDDKQRILLQNFLTVVNRVPASAQESTLAERAGDEAAFKNAWNFNLSDAAFGWLVLDISNGRVSAEWKAQGFNFSYRRSGAQLAAPTSMPHQHGSSQPTTAAIIGTQSQQNPTIKPRASAAKEDGKSVKEDAEEEEGDVEEEEQEEDEEKNEGIKANGGYPNGNSLTDIQHKVNLYTIFISGLRHLPVTEEDIRDFFGNVAPSIRRVRLMHDRNTQQQRSFCYVDFANESAFEDALRMDGKELGENKLKIAKADPDFSAAGVESSRGGRRPRGRAGYYAKAAHFNPEALDVDLRGWNCVVTGANRGLGRETVLELAKRGAKVHMLCRNAEAGEIAMREILKEINSDADESARLILHVVDVADPLDLKAFADEMINRREPVDVLVNNAGVMIHERKQTRHGVEQTFATNVLGTYYLTTLLMPLLQESRRGRVVNVSSGGAYFLKLETNDVEFKNSIYNGYTAYASSKRAQIELTEYWARKYENSGVCFYSMHPGWADTPGVQNSMQFFYKNFYQLLRTASQGADTIVWAAISPEVEYIPNGSFLFGTQPKDNMSAYSVTHDFFNR